MKRGLFSGKKGISQTIFAAGEIVAGLMIVMALFQGAKTYGSRDIVSLDFLSKDIGMTIDALLAAPAPSSINYQVSGFKLQTVLQITSTSATAKQGNIQRSFQFAPDSNSPVKDSSLTLDPDKLNSFAIGRDYDGVRTGNVFTPSKKEICGALSIAANPKILFLFDKNLDSWQGFFSGTGRISTTDDSQIAEMKPDLVIVIKQSDDPSAMLSFKSKEATRSRTLACLLSNELQSYLVTEMPILPGNDATLDQAINYPAALLNIPKKSSAQDVSIAVNNALSRLKP